MNGKKIRHLRLRLGLTPCQFAELVGSSLSSVYRWESREDTEWPVDPHQLRVLTLIDQQIENRSKTAADTLARQIAEGLIIGGGLVGLHRLLDAAFGPPSAVVRRKTITTR